MVGSAFGDGTIDIWDTSARDDTPKLTKSLTVKDHINGTIVERQGEPLQHQGFSSVFTALSVQSQLISIHLSSTTNISLV
jgi:hypothetical protein